MSEIAEKVRDIVAETLDLNEKRDTIKDGTRFVEDLGADSLYKLEIIMNLENEYNIDIPDEDAEKLTTFKDVVDYITAQTVKS